MDPARSATSQQWNSAIDDSSVEAEEASKLAVATPAGDHTSTMKDASSIPQGLEESRRPARKEAGETTSPRLRLAGTQAGPLTPQVRMLLELRTELMRALAVQEEEADLIRARLERNGRADPIAVVTGTDAFTRSDRSIRRALSEIDGRLARLDGRAAVVEIDPGARDLLDRH